MYLQEPFYIIFVEPVLLRVEEHSEVVLSFTEPGSGGPYEDITWSKGGTSSIDYRIVFLKPAVNIGEPLYYNDYCSGASPCGTSGKGQLNTDTGDFTIHKVSLTDSGFYYYNFFIDNGTSNTGIKYEIDVEVYGKGKSYEYNLYYMDAFIIQISVKKNAI